jgi:hypothetical protein
MQGKTEKLIRHFVLLKFKDEVSQEQIKEVGQAFLALPAQITAILHLEWGQAINAEAPYTHCLMATCRNEADLKAYEGHPAHQAVPQAFGHLVASAVVFDYWTNA